MAIVLASGFSEPPEPAGPFWLGSPDVPRVIGFVVPQYLNGAAFSDVYPLVTDPFLPLGRVHILALLICTLILFSRILTRKAINQKDIPAFFFLSSILMAAVWVALFVIHQIVPVFPNAIVWGNSSGGLGSSAWFFVIVCYGAVAFGVSQSLWSPVSYSRDI
ncbi:MAG: hypothetical protein AAF250_12580 [Pseudomonadota bacterium]